MTQVDRRAILLPKPVTPCAVLNDFVRNILDITSAKNDFVRNHIPLCFSQSVAAKPQALWAYRLTLMTDPSSRPTPITTMGS